MREVHEHNGECPRHDHDAHVLESFAGGVLRRSEEEELYEPAAHITTCTGHAGDEPEGESGDGGDDTIDGASCSLDADGVWTMNVMEVGTLDAGCRRNFANLANSIGDASLRVITTKEKKYLHL